MDAIKKAQLLEKIWKVFRDYFQNYVSGTGLGTNV